MARNSVVKTTEWVRNIPFKASYSSRKVQWGARGALRLLRNSFACQWARENCTETRFAAKKGPKTDRRRALRHPTRRAPVPGDRIKSGGWHRRGDQARPTSPNTLSASTAMMHRAGRSEEGAVQTGTCTGRLSHLSHVFASFAKGGLAGDMHSFRCHSHPTIHRRTRKGRASSTMTRDGPTSCVNKA